MYCPKVMYSNLDAKYTETQVPYRVAGSEADLQRRTAGIRQYWSSHTMIMSKYSYSHICFSHRLTKLLSLLHHFMIVGLYVCHWSTGHPQQTEDQYNLWCTQWLVWCQYLFNCRKNCLVKFYSFSTFCSPVRLRDWPILIKHVNLSGLLHSHMISLNKKRTTKTKLLLTRQLTTL